MTQSGRSSVVHSAGRCSRARAPSCDRTLRPRSPVYYSAARPAARARGRRGRGSVLGRAVRLSDANGRTGCSGQRSGGGAHERGLWANYSAPLRAITQVGAPSERARNTQEYHQSVTGHAGGPVAPPTPWTERAEAAQIPLHARAATQVVSVVKCL